MAQTKTRAKYRADYLLKITVSNQINYIQRIEELTVQPVHKIWRITGIKIIREKRWTVKAARPTSSPPVPPLKN